jgi:ADP-heptose:LPS heptosyltransferase
MFLGIDSGAMHLAAAVGVKCIAVFVNTDPNIVGPKPLCKHTIIQKSSSVAGDIIRAIEKCK